MRRLATAAFSFSAAIYITHYITARTLICAAVVLALAPLSMLLRGDARKRALIISLALAAGFVWSGCYTAVFYSPARILDGKTETVRAIVTDYPAQTDYGGRVYVRIHQRGKPDIAARLYVSGYVPALEPGDNIEFTASFSLSDSIRGERTDVFSARGEFIFAYLSGEITVTGSEGYIRFLPKRLTQSVSNMIGELYGERLTPFMRALLAGRAEELNGDIPLTGALSVSGVSHAISVSGMHIAFVVGFLCLIVKRRRLLAAIAIPVLVVFMAMFGFTPAITRAGVMQILLLCAPLVRRESDGVTSLSFALMILLAINPYACASVGLQLSFSASLGIILFTSRIDLAFAGALSKKAFYDNGLIKLILRFVLSSLASTAGALVFTVPLTALHFGYVSLIAPLSNIVVLWAISLAFSVGLISCVLGFIFLPLGVAAALIASVPASLTITAVRLLARVPFASVYVSSFPVMLWLVYAYSLAVSLAALRAKTRQILLVACLAAVSLCAVFLVQSLTSGAGDMSVTALDVGQGQSVAISSGGFTAIVDCGSSSGENAGFYAHEYLVNRGAASLDLLILTHFHSDHVNGVEYLLNMVNVSALAVPDPDIGGSGYAEDIIELARKRGTDIIYVTETMIFSFSDTQITVFPPLGDESENERCLSILCSENGFKALITGDMDAKGERRLLRFTALPDIDILIAGHHGSAYSTSEELLHAVRPEIAIISCGYNNYGHPAEQTLKRLSDFGVTVWRTDISGNITAYARITEERDHAP